ncbi:DMT family transporter [Micromonospora sp. NBC_00898]|uniref:thrombospondin n=1 Tax=Micromonospora sp. NBC_00898 TaxID=2975981 RepID=UPI00386EA910|nr:DMT family transporter [Micromonospora sp. NBC_00898]
MKILSRRNGPAQSGDVNGDGRVDERDRTATTDPVDGTAARPVVTDRDDDGATYRSSSTAADGDRTSDAERRAADRAGTARAATAAPAARDTLHGTDPDPTLERTVDLDRNRTAERPVDPDRTVVRPVPTDRERADLDAPTAPVAVGPRPRASLLATLGLIVSVVGALFVLTGTLAGYGVGLGAVGAVLAVLGLIATRRRHVAGKLDALIGITVGLAAVVLGVVALTGRFDWPTTDGDWVGRFREWLDSQFAGLF